MTEQRVYDPATVGVPAVVGQPQSSALLMVLSVTPQLFQPLWDERLAPLFDVRPDLQLSLFAPPLIMGEPPVRRNGLRWGMYGYSGAHYECEAWTSGDARDAIQAGLDLGYDPMIVPPTWAWDFELGSACVETGVVLIHTREQDPKTPNLLAYPGPKHLRDTGRPHLKVLATLAGLKHVGAFSPYAVQYRYSEFLSPHECALKVPLAEEVGWGDVR